MMPLLYWRTDAVVRLLVSIFICLYAGSVAGLAAHRVAMGKADTGFLLITVCALLFLAASLVLVWRPFTGSRTAWQIGAAMGTFYGGMLLGWWAHSLTGPASPYSVAQMVMSGLGFQGATIVLVALFVREHGVHWREAFGLDVSRGQSIAYGIFFAGLFLPFAWLMQVGSVEVLRHIPGLDPAEQQAVQTLRMAEKLGQRVMLGVITIALAPIAEELLFRGVLYRWIRQFGYPNAAIWMTSLLFAAVHFNLATFIPLALFSVGLTMLYQRQGNLLASITAHATFNALNFSLLYLMEKMETLR
jgi:membrane protease YdiL (CAAX protease family)